MSARTTPWTSVMLAAVASVSWAFLAMAGTAALALHLLGADTAGSLGPMTAAVVAMAVGGKVRPGGDVGAFGLSGSQTQGAIGIAPLGVALVGALLLSWVFLRSLRRAGPTVGVGELAARVVTTAVLFLAVLGGLAWAGQDTVAIDGAALGPSKGTTDDLLSKLPGVGKISGGLTDGLQGLIQTKASITFQVATGRTLAGGLVWVLGVLLIALLASRRTPLPAGWEGAHRAVRPAVSALTVVMVVAVLAGDAAACYAALTGDEPGRIMGAALIGAPNGVWLAVPLGLFVPWKGQASGPLTSFLPDPVDKLLAGGSGKTITPGALAELDGRVWLLPVAIAVMMLLAGALAATRTPLDGATKGGFVGRCAVRLGLVTAVALPLLSHLSKVKVNANLSVFGFDAVGAGVDLHGSLPLGLLLGAVWGAGMGAVGALLALATGAAGQQVAALARPGRGALPDTGDGAYDSGGPAPGAEEGVHVSASAGGDDAGRTYPELAYRAGPYLPSPVYRPEDGEEPNPYAGGGEEPNPYAGGGAEPNPYAGGGAEPNPYAGPRPGDEPNPYKTPQAGGVDAAPTIAGPPPPGFRRPRGGSGGAGASGRPEEKWPEPPPPPPPAAPRGPR
ncbi:streptophobe family protein [Streptomyces sp. NPDC008139]|uniref:streptophobe family protein n=1 Tax=Streptomyces sp. NPDC008139 TaxID=3364814 RepID=UPI0036F18EDC